MALRWPRRSARKAAAPGAAGSSPAAPPASKPPTPTAAGSTSVRIIASGTPADPSYVWLEADAGSCPACPPETLELGPQVYGDPARAMAGEPDARDVAMAYARESKAPPELPRIGDGTMLAVASAPGKHPEEWRQAYPLWMAHPHATGAVYAVEMTAAQLRARLAEMDGR